MNRKLICVTALLALALTACGGEEEQPSDPTQPVPESAAPATQGPDSYVFQSGDVTIAIDQDMGEVLAALGEAQTYFEAASCAFEGLDKTYTYSGFVVTTRPDGEKDYVNSILLTDDSVTTPEGLYIGSTAEDVVAAYGETEGTATALTYTKGGTVLSFILENDTVISIEYLPA